MANHRNSHLFSLLLLLVSTVHLATSSPIPQSSTPASQNPFCRSRSQVNHAYNIGADFYLVQSSMSVFSYNAASNQLDPQKHTLVELFGKNFQWVDTVISLAGFCEKSSLCSDETWRPIERLYIVIGNRRLSSGQKAYGYALYEKDTETDFKLLNTTTIEQSLADKLTKIGLPLKQDEQEAGLMIGDFWPKFSDNFYYQSGMFFPEKGELLFNVYDNANIHGPRQILRRRFAGHSGPDGEQWAKMELEGLESAGSNFDLTGIFKLGTKTYGMDKSMTVYEMQWNQDDKLNLVKVSPMHEFVNCYQNSTIAGEAAKKEAISKADPSENSLKPEAESTKTSSSSSSFSAQPETPSATTVTTSTTTPTSPSPSTTTTLRPTEPEVEIFDGSSSTHHHHHQHHQSENKSGEMLEKEDSENELDRSRNQKEASAVEEEFDVAPQGDDPRTHQLAEASARGPFNPNDNGLIWTFSILVGVLILLAIIILIPILIIRHNARSDRMYINKTTKKPTTTPSSQNSEEVQLMNSSNIEK